MIGAYVPQCDADGSYSSVQCHGSTGQCWCVDNTGAEVQGTRVPPTSMVIMSADTWKVRQRGCRAKSKSKTGTAVVQRAKGR